MYYNNPIMGVDLSVYQGIVSRDSWQGLKNTGYNLAIVGSWHGASGNPWAVGNFDRAKAEGFEHLATYTVISPGVDGKQAVRRAKGFCGTHWKDMDFVAIDVELEGVTLAQIRQAIQEVELEGLRPIIYTAYWFWHDVFNNPQGFSRIKLWNAFYDSDDDIDFATYPYGAWKVEDVVGEQFKGTTNLYGTQVDLNVFNRDWLVAPSVVKPSLPIDKQLVLHNGFTFAERRSTGHYWWMPTPSSVEAYINDGWSPPVTRPLVGTRVDK